MVYSVVIAKEPRSLSLPRIFEKNSRIFREYFLNSRVERTGASHRSQPWRMLSYGTASRHKLSQRKVEGFPFANSPGKNISKCSGIYLVSSSRHCPRCQGMLPFCLAPVMPPGNIAEHDVSSISPDLSDCDRSDRQPRCRRHNRVFQRLAVGADRNEFGAASRPADCQKRAGTASGLH